MFTDMQRHVNYLHGVIISKFYGPQGPGEVLCSQLLFIGVMDNDWSV
jgi:hypothetical protein